MKISHCHLFGGDFAAGACIGLISIALIDNCNAKIYYLDDEMKYTREMLKEDTPQFLNELKKEKNRKSKGESKLSMVSQSKEKNKGIWNIIRDLFK